jgi:N4-gp56 family major capsid protein
MQPNLITQRFGRAEQQELNSGRTRIWRRYHNLPPQTAPLVEGVDPEGQRMTYTDISAYLQEYGDLLVLTNVVADTHEDPILQEMKSKCADQAAQSVELVTIEVLKSGSQVMYSGGTTRGTVATGPLRNDFRKITRTLKRNLAAQIGNVISASPDVSTRGVEKAYYAMCSTDLESDLRNITGFTLVVEYGNSGSALENEFGALEGIRFLTSQNFTPWLASGASGTDYLSNTAIPSGSAAGDVYPIIVVGRDAYGVVRLQGKGAAVISVLNPKVTHATPMGNRGFVSWHLWYTAVILNDLWMVRYEVLCKANPG